MPKGQQLRSAAAIEAEAKFQRNAHAMVVQEHGRWGGMPARHVDWHYDLRRGQNRIYGSLLRWIDTVLEKCETLADLESARQRLLHIPSWITEYIGDRATDLRRGLRKHHAFGVWTRDGTEAD